MTKEIITKAIFICYLLLTLILNAYAQESLQWDILNQDAQSGFQRIYFVDDHTGWLTGPSRVLKTVDGGEEWYPFTVPENISHETIQFQTAQSGWAKGHATADNDGIFKTVDGGQSWVLKKELNGNNFQSFSAVNDSTVYVVEKLNSPFETSRLLKTTNSGLSWVDVSPPYFSHFNEICFISESIGIVTSSYADFTYVDRTIDGGRSWNGIDLGANNIHKIKSLSESTIYFCLNNSSDTTYFCSTRDTFNTWTVDFVTEDDISSYSFYDDSTLFAVIVDNTEIIRPWQIWVLQSPPQYSVQKSVNRGHTWEIKQYLGWGGDQVWFKDSNTGFILGESALYKTADGGNSWQAKSFNFPFNDVFFINNEVGFACGGSGWCGPHIIDYWQSEGRLYKTNDGGKNWNINFSIYNAEYTRCVWQSGEFKSIEFIDETNAFLLNGKSIYKTNDGGISWTESFINNPDSLFIILDDFYLLDKNRGWAIGEFVSEDSAGTIILKTNDGGVSWDIEERYAGGFSSIYFVNNTGWAVGWAGMIIKYTEQNHWQLQPFVPDLPLNKVFFFDQQHGWIIAGYFNSQDFQSTIFKTTNGGENWHEFLLKTYLIKDIFFSDSLCGWAVGNDTVDHGVILKTTNGGENWIPVVENLPASLNALHFKDGYGWAVGDNGLVLRTDNWTTWIDQSSGKVYPSKYSLKQNYPNPFNPTTMISYTIGNVRTRHAVSQHVQLSIYNTLGQKVAILVNKKQTAGSYKVEWDAAGFASGVYYYYLKAGEFEEVKKMLLIK